MRRDSLVKGGESLYFILGPPYAKSHSVNRVLSITAFYNRLEHLPRLHSVISVMRIIPACTAGSGRWTLVKL
jgi:hypothetical protein